MSNEAVRAIEFALKIEDDFEVREFLTDWMEGDTSGWSMFDASKLQPNWHDNQAATLAEACGHWPDDSTKIDTGC